MSVRGTQQKDLQSNEVDGLAKKQNIQTSLNASSEPQPSSGPVKQQTASLTVEKKVKKKKKIRCGICNKKIKKSLQLSCRCGGIFCAEHRIPCDHKCTFDYKLASC